MNPLQPKTTSFGLEREFRYEFKRKMTAAEVIKALQKVAEPDRVGILQRFFKTAPGEYGAGDVFIGVRVPNQRAVSRVYRDLPLAQIRTLLKSPIHEHRLTGLFILVLQFKKTTTETEKKRYADFYLKYRTEINNWDLIDSSAPYILGEYFYDHDRTVIYDMARSKNLWDRRMAILTSFFWLRQRDDFVDTFNMSEWLINDKEDLIQKAVGWMLREIGKRDRGALLLWLNAHSVLMPRTMLRYAIEKLPVEKRAYYLAKKG